jgi:hypothetical protein
MLESNLESGLVPDEDLQLYINDSPVEDLHKKIDLAGNFEILQRDLVSESCHCLFAANYSKRSVYSLQIDTEFDFNALSWSVTDYRINGKTVGFILDVSYNGESLEYKEGDGVDYQDIWLDEVTA